MCSKNMEEIYRRTLMQVCDFNKNALHFDILTLEFCIFVLLILVLGRRKTFSW